MLVLKTESESFFPNSSKRSDTVFKSCGCDWKDPGQIIGNQTITVSLVMIYLNNLEFSL